MLTTATGLTDRQSPVSPQTWKTSNKSFSHFAGGKRKQTNRHNFHFHVNENSLKTTTATTTTGTTMTRSKYKIKKIAQKMVIRTSVAVCENPMCLFWGDVEMQIDLK